MTPEEKVASMAARLSRRMEKSVQINYPIRAKKMAEIAVLWNRKMIDGDEVAEAFCKIFKADFLKEWGKYVQRSLSPTHYKLSDEERKARGREAQRKFRAEHPNYYRDLQERRKLKEQGGFYETAF